MWLKIHLHLFFNISLTIAKNKSATLETLCNLEFSQTF